MKPDFTNTPITVILADDHPVVRTGYRRLLESTTDIQVIAEADDGEMACHLYQEHKPDVLILDLNMPGIGGLETIHRIKTKNPDACILIFSMHANETLLKRALKAGAMGYITKQSGAKQMVQAIRLVKQGKTYIDPALASSITVSMTTFKPTHEDPLNMLTAREFQIFKLIAEGNSIAQISETLSISPKTGGVHHTNIMKKLKLQNTAQLVRLAISCNIIQTETFP
ncbi:MAG: response regulator transcription factor [Nitrosomonas sp.]|nr:response regulator transcription factor [Nitrosomonas sp.]MDP1950207.1 response regulator transcription factor [Nitrosomonas sp.]